MKSVEFSKPRQRAKNAVADFLRAANESATNLGVTDLNENLTPHTPLRVREGGKSYRQDKINENSSQIELLEVAIMDQIKDLAKKLTASERKKVISSLVLDTGERKLRDVDMWVTSLLEVCMSRKNISQVGFGPAVLKEHVGSRSAWHPVAEFMATTKLNELRVVDRQSIYRMLAELVVDNARGVARSANIAFTARLIANCASNVGSLFDNAYPGAIYNGYAHLVAQRYMAGVDA